MRWIVRSGLILIALTAVRAAVRSSPPPPLPVPAASSIVIPVAGACLDHVRSEFNDWRGNHRHHALDILAPRGTPVVAATDGRIRKLLTSRAGGLTIYEFDPTQTLVYYYAHLDHYAAGLQEGDEVRAGDVIGYVGTTGNAPPNTPHLHFAIGVLPPGKQWWKGQAIDPYPILRDHGVAAEVGPIAR